jgi:hypothetical protein
MAFRLGPGIELASTIGRMEQVVGGVPVQLPADEAEESGA